MTFGILKKLFTTFLCSIGAPKLHSKRQPSYQRSLLPTKMADRKLRPLLFTSTQHLYRVAKKTKRSWTYMRENGVDSPKGEKNLKRGVSIPVDFCILASELYPYLPHLKSRRTAVASRAQRGCYLGPEGLLMR